MLCGRKVFGPRATTGVNRTNLMGTHSPLAQGTEGLFPLLRLLLCPEPSEMSSSSIGNMPFASKLKMRDPADFNNRHRCYGNLVFEREPIEGIGKSRGRAVRQIRTGDWASP